MYLCLSLFAQCTNSPYNVVFLQILALISEEFEGAQEVNCSVVE